MRIAISCLLALMLGVLTLWSCQKEISFEDNGGANGGSNNGNPGWSFSATNTNYHGCIDTAYYETISGMHTLTIEGTDSAANEFSISLISQTPFAATTYTVAQGALMTYTNSSGDSYISSSPSSFSIKNQFHQRFPYCSRFHCFLI
jgi:hypothetical protein